MIVGIVYLEMYIPQAGSLKEKRSILSSLKQKILNQFNVSVAEVDFFDKWQRAAFGIGVVSAEMAHLDSILAKLEAFIAQEFRITITRWDVRLA